MQTRKLNAIESKMKSASVAAAFLLLCAHLRAEPSAPATNAAPSSAIVANDPGSGCSKTAAVIGASITLAMLAGAMGWGFRQERRGHGAQEKGGEDAPL